MLVQTFAMVGSQYHQALVKKMLLAEEFPKAPQHLVNVPHLGVISALAVPRAKSAWKVVRGMEIVEMKEQEEGVI